MTARFVISGTDTSIGKTVFAAALSDALGATYWKPVQAGLEAETDSETVARLGGLSARRILPEAYRLTAPLSPHLAACMDKVSISAAKLAVPPCHGSLVIEGAGGLLVPLAQGLSFADIFVQWRIPVILCARTALGTINHSLLSIEALQKRHIPLHGIAFIGEDNPDTQDIIATMGRIPVLGRLPLIENLNRHSLRQAFADNFNLQSFLETPL